MLSSTVTWQQEKEHRRQKALERHWELHRLYKENRFLFERKCRKMIEDFINSVEDPEIREKLWDLQKAWDKRMQKAGSNHNRFVLAQSFFWDHFYEKWLPTLKGASESLSKNALQATVRLVRK